MRTNATKAKLQLGQPVFGCFLRYPDSGLVEVLGYQGLDFIVFDGEHGTIEPRDCEHMVRAAELRDVTPIVRATTNSPSIILRFMDSGAQGVHIPWVNSAAEAQSAVRSVKYQPLGIRGLASVRAADYAQTYPIGEYVRQSNAETLVVVQVETAEAIEHLPEILAVEGLDVIFIGPTDLSHSLGVPGNPKHPKVAAAMQRIIEETVKSKITPGIMVGDAEGAREWMDRGARYITVTFESLLRPAVRQYLESARA